MARLTIWGFLCAGLLTACGDDSAMETDAGMADTGSPDCRVDSDCDNGLFCDGVEACSEGVCVSGAALECDDGIACTLDVCDEDLNRCVSAAPDADADGVRDAACTDAEGMALGADCDDSDPNRFPGNPEVCDEEMHDEDCNLETFGALDRDRDGFFDARCCNPAATPEGMPTCGQDCNDVRISVNPSATEACDRVDNDCDSMIDEGVAVAGFADADRDGFGDPDTELTSCPGVAGFVPAGGEPDCDDDDSARNPGQVEVCDMADNDCDPQIDESPQVVDWFLDVDGDGFGAASSGSVRSCSPPDPVDGNSFVLLGTDCNDGVAGVNPAAAEQCNALDDDCNGSADFEIAAGDFEDDDEDGVADVGCGAPRGIDCDDLDPVTAAGGAEACDGRDNDCDDVVDEGATDCQWFYDGDMDGHGSPANTMFPVLSACRPEPGYVASGGDCADSDPMRSPSAMEQCNSVDDNCDGSIDEGNICGCTAGTADCNSDNVCEVNTLSDNANCGGCGMTCTNGANARGTFCASGTCQIASCRGGFEDCDAIGTNGCEVNLRTDAGNCGDCGTVCTAPAGTNVRTVRCDDGGCAVGACDDGFDDCDGDLSNGCETPIAGDPDNCGGCGVECFNPLVGAVSCSGGQCQFPCVPNETGDCDGNAANGCETVLLERDNCGACGNACPADSAATRYDCFSLSGSGPASCQPTCGAGFADCDPMMAGCETTLLDSACACPGDTAIDCTAFGDANATYTCRGTFAGQATCSFQGCDGGFSDCGGFCADTDGDPQNCGGCGINCGAGGSCVMGTCSCGRGTVDCGNAGCIDINRDPRNCGGCGIDCGPDDCIGGTCTAFCSFPNRDCDGSSATVCETDVTSDPANCGSCGNACPTALSGLNVTSSTCVGGSCDLNCDNGFEDCDFDVSSGCETPTTTEQDCGSCGVSCGIAGTCTLGFCDQPSSVAVSASHTCVAYGEGGLACFGAGGDGRLGNGGTVSSTVPVAVTSLPGAAIAVATGRAHSCALLRTGGDNVVACWGDNQFGQLGDGTTTDRSTPVVVSFPVGRVPESITLGRDHSCSLVRDPGGFVEAMCWGLNADGQLGDESNTNRSTPVFPTIEGSPIEVTTIAAGGHFTCALEPDFGSLPITCWGDNTFGQLGDGTTTDSNSPSFASVPSPGFGSDLLVGDTHACVFTDMLWCWGDNTGGLVQDAAPPGPVLSPSPLMLPTTGSTDSIHAGQGTLCAHQFDRSLWCRGDNSSGIVPGGPPTLAGWTRVNALATVSDDVFLGPTSAHQAALSAGEVLTWGLNTSGQLGLGNLISPQPPTQVGGL